MASLPHQTKDDLQACVFCCFQTWIERQVLSTPVADQSRVRCHYKEEILICKEKGICLFVKTKEVPALLLNVKKKWWHQQLLTDPISIHRHVATQHADEIFQTTCFKALATLHLKESRVCKQRNPFIEDLLHNHEAVCLAPDIGCFCPDELMNDGG